MTTRASATSRPTTPASACASTTSTTSPYSRSASSRSNPSPTSATSRNECGRPWVAKISIVVQLSYLGQQLPAGGGSGGGDGDDGGSEGPEATVCDVQVM